MADDAAMAAAAALLEDTDPVEDLLGPAPVVADDLAGRVVAEPEQVAEQTAPDEPDFDLSAYQADTSGLDWLEDEPEPQEDDELEEVPDFGEVEAPVAPQAEWDDDEEKAQLRRQVEKLRKQQEWSEKQRVAQAQKKWREEAARRFPFCDASEITTTSRRATLRVAKAQHDRVLKKVNPLLEALEELRGQTASEARQEARAEAAKAWGKPAVSAGAPQPVAVRESGNPRFEKGKGLVDLIKDRLNKGEYGPI